MGCYTGYLLRDEDGASWFAETKYGVWQLVDDAERAMVVDRVRGEGRLLDGTSGPLFTASTCRGVALDLRDRVFRCFPCEGMDDHSESVEQRIRTAPHWAGWDAGLAWGGREELGDVVPAARHVIVPYDLTFRPLAELPFGDRERDEGDLVSVVTAARQVLDYQLARTYADADNLLPWLVHGDRLVDALRAEEPYELPWYDVDGGVVIDLGRRVLSYWTDGFVPPRLLAEVRAAWPGFEVRRLPHGLDEHLAATGRNDQPST